MAPIAGGCSVSFTYTDGSFVVREARLDATEDGQPTVDLLVNSLPPGGTISLSCPNQPVPLVLPNQMISGMWQPVHQSDRVGSDYRFTDFEAVDEGPSEGGRSLVARKEVTRTAQPPGGTITVTTRFELWALSDSPE
jgi:hypothetical protein